MKEGDRKAVVVASKIKRKSRSPGSKLCGIS